MIGENGWDMIGVEARDALALLYGQLKTITQAVAHKGQKITLQCSSRTFNEHLDEPYMVAGPWAWDIDDSIEFGRVNVCVAGANEYAERGRIEASFNITDGSITH